MNDGHIPISVTEDNAAININSSTPRAGASGGLAACCPLIGNLQMSNMCVPSLT